MNKTLFSILSTVVLLNTACSPKQDEASTTTVQSSSMSSEASEAVSSQATAITPAETTSTPNGELVNTYWKLILLNDTEIIVMDNQREPHIVLNAENRLSGSDGCNRLMGTYLLDGEKLTLGEMAGTRMACAEGAAQAQAQAQAFNESLTKVATYTVHSDQLELRDATGLVLARFKAVALP